MENKTVLKAESYFGGECIIEFNETGFEIIKDDRQCKDGYLHIINESANEITEACRNQIVQYFYNHSREAPGIGATATDRYFKGLTRDEAEKIGNEGKKAFYNY